MSYTNQVLFLGDSIMLGSHLPSPSTQAIPVLVASAVPDIAAHYQNLAIGSTTADSDGGQGATADGLYSASYDVNLFVVLFGANDLANGDSAATFEAHLKTYAQARLANGPKARVVILTTLDNSLISDHSQRTSANALTRADGTFWQALADIARDPVMGIDGAYNNGTYFLDGTHPNAAGNVLLEPYVSAAINTLIVPRSMAWRSV